MSGIVGFAHTIRLAQGCEAIVTARRGEAYLRPPEGEPILLVGSLVALWALGLRRSLLTGEDCARMMWPGQTLDIARDCAEPLIALMAQAVKFAEGGGDG